ncbi:MAG: SDR family oxidoreductase [Rhizobacter sp.]|nr:SDR family oxidoreductase [Chlorobiales bacterium]
MTLYTLITGASSGIGKTFAEELASRKKNLILTARSEEKLNVLAASLESAHGISVKVCLSDLSSAGGARRVFEFCKANELNVEAVINNAGVGLTGKFASQPLEPLERIMQLNMISVVNLTHLFLPQMLARKSGKILNVASTAAFQGVPDFAVYAATKAFVLSFTEALHEELSDTGVSATVICPGPTATAFFETAHFGTGRSFTGVEKVEDVVRSGLAAMEKGKSLKITAGLNRTLTFASRFLPRKLVTKVANIFIEVAQ